MDEQSRLGGRSKEKIICRGSDGVACSAHCPIAVAEAMNHRQPGLLGNTIGNLRPGKSDGCGRTSGFQQTRGECVAQRDSGFAQNLPCRMDCGFSDVADEIARNWEMRSGNPLSERIADCRWKCNSNGSDDCGFQVKA